MNTDTPHPEIPLPVTNPTPEPVGGKDGSDTVSKSPAPGSLGPAPEPAPAAPEPSAAPVRVIAIGTAGLATLRELAQHRVPLTAAAAVHSDSAALNDATAEIKLHVDIESSHLRALASGADPEECAEEHLPRLRDLCVGSRVVLLIAGMGGGAGTSLAPVLARAARESGAFVIAFAVLPFDCEGNLRAEVARHGLQRLQDTAHLVISFPNQRTIALIDDGTTLAETFKTSNQLLAAAVASAWEACSGQNLMGMPFTDLCELMRRRSPESRFAVADATGANRTAEVLDRLLKHPLMPNSLALAQVSALGVVLLGGPTLAMIEIDRLMERLQRDCGGVPILMSTFIVPDLGDTLRAGILIPIDPVESGESPASATPVLEPARLGQGSRADLDDRIVDRTTPLRPAARFIAPPPGATPERIEQLRKPRKSGPRMRQGQLPLEIVSKGRFEKSEPTIHAGEDLDIPTYIRRHVALN